MTHLGRELIRIYPPVCAKIRALRRVCSNVQRSMCGSLVQDLGSDCL